MHIAALENINDVAITGIKDQVAPTDFMHFAGQFDIIIPSPRLTKSDRIVMSAAGTRAKIDKGVVIDIFICKFSEAVTACFMLHHAARIERIAVVALRTESDRRTVFPQLTDTTVISAVGYYNYKCLIEVVVVDRRSVKSVVKHRIVITFETDSTGISRVKLVVTNSVNRSNSSLCRERETMAASMTLFSFSSQTDRYAISMISAAAVIIRNTGALLLNSPNIASSTMIIISEIACTIIITIRVAEFRHHA